jgi:putative hydrolase
MGPGSNNPFGFDLSELIRMLQSPGPVNMEIARRTAHESATHDPETGEGRPEPAPAPAAIAAFDDVVRAAQVPVAEATGISAALTVPARPVDRKAWSDATLQGLETVLASLAGALGRGQVQAAPGAEDPAAVSPEAFLGMLMQQLVPLLLGAWSGSMIGALSHHALGQYDLPLPLTGEPAMLFVVNNVEAFGREWSLPNDELRYALALREVVHGAQRAIPWVRDRLVRLASSYVSAYEVQTDALEEQFSRLDLTDPSSMTGLEKLSDPEVLLGAMQSERQKPLLAEMQRFAAVLEGYTDVVVETLGERMVASHVRIDEALRRHRLERGNAATFVDRLLGLELDRDHYDAGLAFCRGVVERSDGTLEQLNRLWTREEILPTPSEFTAPGLWLARIDLPES